MWPARWLAPAAAWVELGGIGTDSAVGSKGATLGGTSLGVGLAKLVSLQESSDFWLAAGSATTCGIISFSESCDDGVGAAACWTGAGIVSRSVPDSTSEVGEHTDTIVRCFGGVFGWWSFSEWVRIACTLLVEVGCCFGAVNLITESASEKKAGLTTEE